MLSSDSSPHWSPSTEHLEFFQEPRLPEKTAEPSPKNISRMSRCAPPFLSWPLCADVNLRL